MLAAFAVACCFAAALHALDAGRLLAAFERLGGAAGVFRDWQALIADAKDIPVPERLQRVNDFFNRRIRPAEDQDVWGQQDYWATPLETLARGRGDCEDYAIAKYFTLLDAGVPRTQLRLVYVKVWIEERSGFQIQTHMVLAYYARPDAEPLVLDNLVRDIRPAGKRPDLVPVLSFNIQGAWKGAAGSDREIPGGNGHLSRWQDLLARARAEGFD